MPINFIKDDCNNNAQQGGARCDSRIIDSTTLGECSNWHREPYGRPGPIVVKVPVVLSSVKIQIDVESEIRLEEPAFDIKTIDKNVCITQCHLVPHTNKLFIAGFVQKNIQYSTVDCSNNTSVSGRILHTTLNVPFRCVTAIQFDKYPQFGKSFKKKSNVLDKKMLCEDNREQSWLHFNKAHEPIFCELEWAKILETEIFDRDIECAERFTREDCFQDFVEKMVIYLQIKVLQNQQVFIPEPHCDVYMDKDCEDEDEEYNDYVEIGYMPEKGMVARKMKEEKY
ncbi:hypothetical protein GCM10008905_23200 [Clostridium malenominatum]|uniref:DUF7852 domain-containing protein n=1 Tax=Clostridium malenominatum TaxID=1539 RepID=A0ABN1J306_9CLOT